MEKNLTREISDCGFGLARTSATPYCHAISGAFKQETVGASARRRKFKGEGGRPKNGSTHARGGGKGAEVKSLLR